MDEAEKSLLLKMISGMSAKDTTEKTSASEFLKEPLEYVEKLKKRKKALEEKNAFKVGDVIVWKDGLKNKRLPQYAQPAIVLEIFDTPIVDEDDATATEEIDIQIGFISPDDEFLAFNYDSRRFKNYNH